VYNYFFYGRIFFTERAKETIPGMLKQMDERGQAIHDLLIPQETKALEEGFKKILELSSGEWEVIYNESRNC
jgi:hypothetical protein